MKDIDESFVGALFETDPLLKFDALCHFYEQENHLWCEERQYWKLLSILWKKDGFLQEHIEQDEQGTVQSLLQNNPICSKLALLKGWLEETAPPAVPIEIRSLAIPEFTMRNNSLDMYLDPDSSSRSMRDWNSNDRDYEAAFNQALFDQIRRGDLSNAVQLCCAVGQQWRAAIIVGGHYQSTTKASRKTWKQAVMALATDPKVDAYEGALYAALTGSLSGLLAVARTWQDQLWSRAVCALDDSIERGLSGRSVDADTLGQVFDFVDNSQYFHYTRSCILEPTDLFVESIKDPRIRALTAAAAFQKGILKDTDQSTFLYGKNLIQKGKFHVASVLAANMNTDELCILLLMSSPECVQYLGTEKRVDILLKCADRALLEGKSDMECVEYLLLDHRLLGETIRLINFLFRRRLDQKRRSEALKFYTTLPTDPLEDTDRIEELIQNPDYSSDAKEFLYFRHYFEGLLLYEEWKQENHPDQVVQVLFDLITCNWLENMNLDKIRRTELAHAMELLLAVLLAQVPQRLQELAELLLNNNELFSTAAEAGSIGPIIKRLSNHVHAFTLEQLKAKL